MVEHEPTESLARNQVFGCETVVAINKYNLLMDCAPREEKDLEATLDDDLACKAFVDYISADEDVRSILESFTEENIYNEIGFQYYMRGYALELEDDEDIQDTTIYYLRRVKEENYEATVKFCRSEVKKSLLELVEYEKTFAQFSPEEAKVNWLPGLGALFCIKETIFMAAALEFLVNSKETEASGQGFGQMTFVFS